jgi:DNA-binding SARP family transcriptional activator
MTTEFRFQLLGPVRAWRDGIGLRVGSPQQQAVLAMLLLSRGGHVCLETMIEGLWGERPPKACTGAIRTYVSRIRHALSDGSADGSVLIDATGEGYALHADHMKIDIDLFEAQIAEAGVAGEHEGERAADLCRQALSLWQGAPLAGVPGPYAEPVRARMAELRADAVQIQSAALIAAGDHLSAIAGLRRLVVDLPLREGLHELLMLALYRAGRRADAFEVYADARRILREELGVEPGVSLRRMHQCVLRSDDADADPVLAASPVPVVSPAATRSPALAASLAASPARAPSRPPAPPPSPAPPTTSRLPASVRDFVGRGELLEAVAGSLAGSGAGRHVAVLDGMPGVGKSELAIRAGHLLAKQYPDGQVLLELGGGGVPMPPGQVLASALRAVGGTVYGEVDARAPLALGPAWRELLAGRRLLMVLDDVDSAEQVRPVLATPAGCGFILTSRKRLIGIDDAVHYEVPALDDDVSLVLLEQLIGTDRIDAEPIAARALIAQCGGRPSMIRSLGALLEARPRWRLASAVRHLTESMRSCLREDGESVVAALSSAFRGLSVEQMLVLQAAARLGRPWVHVTQAAAAIGLPETTVHDVFEHLTDIHLLKPGEWGAYRVEPAVRSLARLLR